MLIGSSHYLLRFWGLAIALRNGKTRVVKAATITFTGEPIFTLGPTISGGTFLPIIDPPGPATPAATPDGFKVTGGLSFTAAGGTMGMPADATISYTVDRPFTVTGTPAFGLDFIVISSDFSTLINSDIDSLTSFVGVTEVIGPQSTVIPASVVTVMVEDTPRALPTTPTNLSINTFEFNLDEEFILLPGSHILRQTVEISLEGLLTDQIVGVNLNEATSSAIFAVQVPEHTSVVTIIGVGILILFVRSNRVKNF